MNILDLILMATNRSFLHIAIGSMLSLRPVLISIASLQIIELNAIVEIRIIVLTYNCRKGIHTKYDSYSL